MKGLLILIVIIGLGAVAGAVIIGASYNDGTVVDNAYESGLKWDERQTDGARLGWSVSLDEDSITEGETSFVFSIVDPQGVSLSGSTVNLSAERPSSAEHHITLKVTSKGADAFEASGTLPGYGLWELSFVVSVGHDSLEIKKTIHAKERAR